MKRLLLALPVLLFYGVAQVFGTTPVTVQDFEQDSSLPKLWVVNIPNENASIQLSQDHPSEGKQCLKLHYHFPGGGQYLGVSVPVKIQGPVHKLSCMVYGDNSGSGYGVYVNDASSETHKFRIAGATKIDFTGWKEMVVDLDAGHEIWGGDKNGKMDYPITEIIFEISTPGDAGAEGDLYFDAITVDADKSAEAAGEAAAAPAGEAAVAPAGDEASGMVQNFEGEASPAKVWVVNIPNENASVQLSTDHPSEGKQCLKLHYHFTGGGQYLGVSVPVKIQTPAHKLHYMVYGDNSGSGYGVYVNDASSETHKFRVGKIDFTGWKEAVIDLSAGHEIWGGDKNGKMDYPITEIIFEIGTPGDAGVESDLYFDAITIEADESAGVAVGEVSVTSPAYCADIQGDTPIAVAAPGFKTVTVKCWMQGPDLGTDSTVGEVTLDEQGKGSIVFPADKYPHGPITVRISGQRGSVKDNCYLQLYNKGGVSWNEGIPNDPPPAAKGMKLVFADDFNGPLSIGSDPKATYYDHKPPDGSQDFSAHTFSNYDSPKNPFAQMDTYLRIRASDKLHSAGLISSLKAGDVGVTAKAPCYFECRFIGPNAIGTWPAFWLLTVGHEKGTGCDELDIIEAYGGEGPKAPNSFDLYRTASHAWGQGPEGEALQKAASEAMNNPISMRKFGIPSTWFEALHIYACKITETDTIYYCDNIEVARHKTFPLSKKLSHFFMVNLATGGGWPVDLSRYDGLVDMYVDYVRVYQGE